MSVAQTSPPEEASAIRKIAVLKEADTNVHIVLIPGVGTSPCELWPLNAGPWANFLSQLDQGVTLHSYNHNIALDNSFKWERLLSEGFKLLRAISAFLFSEQLPLLFLCHGLGGAILKQALCIAGVHYERHSKVLMSIAGVVFLGTPHRLEGVTNEQFGERVSDILKLGNASALSRQSLFKLKETSTELLDLAVRFNRTNLRVEMLSIFERKVTNIRYYGAIRSRNKKRIVIDEQLCTISTNTETCLGVDLDHPELPTMTGHDGRPIKDIESWLKAIIAASPAKYEQQLNDTFSLGRVDEENSSSSEQSTPGVASPHISAGATLDVDGNIPESDSHPNTSMYVNHASTAQAEVQNLLEKFSLKQADPRVPCFMMHTFVRNKNFFGRHDVLDSLERCLLPSQSLLVSSQPDRIRVALLCGMGGLGKTETAIEFAYSRQHAFDAVFWIRAEDTSKLESDLAEVAVRLGIQDPDEPDDKVINKDLAYEWLCNPFKIEHGAGSRDSIPATWLIIFDNADNPDILAPYRDIANSGAVLITSRSPLAKTSFSSLAVDVGIQPFGRKEAGDFVQKNTGIDGHFEEAQQIGSRLGGLPLALAQMAGIIRLEFLSYSEFLELYENVEEEDDIHGTVLQPLRATARGNLSTVWAIDKLSPPARAIIEVASFLDPDCIQEALLFRQGPQLNIPAFPKRHRAFLTARGQLIGSSLFRHNQDTAECWMHRVTQDVVRSKMDHTRRSEIFSSALLLVSEAWPAAVVGGHEVTLWPVSEGLYPHVVALKNLYEKYFDPGDPERDIHMARLLIRASWYQHERGESFSILSTLHMTLDLLKHITVIDTSDLESDIRYTLASVANETNDADSCVENSQRVLEIRLAVAQDNDAPDERLCRAYNEMGIAWMMVKDYKQAEVSFATAAREYERLPDFTKDKRSLALVNLGLAHWLQGHFSQASDVLEQGLAEREELYGVMDNHSFRTGRFLHALGNVRYSQGAIESSEDFHKKALGQYQSTIRNRHHRTADVCHKVAQHCLRKGLVDEALGFIEQALKTWRVDAARYAPEIARTSFLQSKVLSSQGREEARALALTAASMREKITGETLDDVAKLEESHFDGLVTFWSR